MTPDQPGQSRVRRAFFGRLKDYADGSWALEIDRPREHCRACEWAWSVFSVAVAVLAAKGALEMLRGVLPWPAITSAIVGGIIVIIIRKAGDWRLERDIAHNIIVIIGKALGRPTPARAPEDGRDMASAPAEEDSGNG